jgi:hypothetical protein
MNQVNLAVGMAAIHMRDTPNHFPIIIRCHVLESYISYSAILSQ